MPLEHGPARSHPPAVTGMDGSSRDPLEASDYWDSFIDEKAAADFLDLTRRTMQGWRQKGGGPRYVAFSSRCLRYTRRWLREHAVAHTRTSTSDPGRGAA